MLREQFTLGGVSFNTKLTLTVIITTILPMLDWYDHRFFAIKAYDRMVYYFIIPMLLVLFLFRERPRDLGFQLGNWREGLLWVGAAALGMAVILWFIARTPAMQAYYAARAPEQPGRVLFLTAVDLFGWEFIWRGFSLFLLARYLGPGPAIWLQAVPFAFMHLNKPEVETLSTIFGGAGFGFIAWRTRSFLYPFLIHWFIASFTMLIAIGVF